MTTPLPSHMDRFIEFMAANPSPIDCVVGKFYQVPCISHEKLKGCRKAWKEWIPLIGPPHQDKEIIGFEPWHMHVDSRFQTLSDLAMYLALAQVINLTSMYELHVGHAEDIRETARLEMRRMKCRRSDPPMFPDVPFRKPLESAYAGCRVVNGLCPHRGIAIACGRRMDDAGARQCPGHGLAWNADGTMAPVAVRDWRMQP